MSKIIDLNYINERRIMSKLINEDNIQKMSNERLNFRVKRFNKKHWDKYSKEVLSNWNIKNLKYTELHLFQYKKIAKKLGVELVNSQYAEYEKIARREFTFRRAFKTIELPYKVREEDNLSQKAIFVYPSISVFSDEKWSKKIIEGNIFITKTELVFYCQKEQRKLLIIRYEDIKKVEYKKYSTLIELKNNTNYLVKYYDNNVLYNSIKRIVNETEILFV